MNHKTLALTVIAAGVAIAGAFVLGKHGRCLFNDAVVHAVDACPAQIVAHELDANG